MLVVHASRLLELSNGDSDGESLDAAMSRKNNGRETRKEQNNCGQLEVGTSERPWGASPGLLQTS